jgi:hypothetical protein
VLDLLLLVLIDINNESGVIKVEAIRVRQTVKKSGELTIRNLPVEKGQQVEVLLLFTPPSKRSRLTARQLLNSELVGLWKDRTDITDNLAYARQLREQAQQRPEIKE